MGWRNQGVVIAGLAVLAMVIYCEACNEAVCASLVSKCMLLKSCECNMLNKDNCTCCKDCHKCLAKLYTECCSCVGMCPETNPKSNLYKTSTVEELGEPIAALFNVLTEEEDEQLRWTTYTYPAHLDLLYFKPRGHSLDLDLGLASSLSGEDGSKLRHGKHRINTRPSPDTTNCTVAYMAQCMSLTKCRDSCQSMGAARYRWFHDYGCCECIGATCLDFGKGEPLCLQCPAADEEEEEEEELEENGDVGDTEEEGVEEIEVTGDSLGGRGSLSRGSEGDTPGSPGRLGGGGGGGLQGGAGAKLSGGSLTGEGLTANRNMAQGDSTASSKKTKHHKKKNKHHAKHDRT